MAESKKKKIENAVSEEMDTSAKAPAREEIYDVVTVRVFRRNHDL